MSRIEQIAADAALYIVGLIGVIAALVFNNFH